MSIKDWLLFGSARKARDWARAKDAIARALCDCHFTDGFCIPSDKPDCRCNALAERCLKQMEVRGVLPVWVCAPEIRT